MSDDDVHVIPEGCDEPDHEATPDCWCKPIQDPRNARDLELGAADAAVWVHNRRPHN